MAAAAATTTTVLRGGLKSWTAALWSNPIRQGGPGGAGGEGRCTRGPTRLADEVDGEGEAATAQDGGVPRGARHDGVKGRGGGGEERRREVEGVEEDEGHVGRADEARPVEAEVVRRVHRRVRDAPRARGKEGGRLVALRREEGREARGVRRGREERVRMDVANEDGLDGGRAARDIDFVEKAEKDFVSQMPPSCSRNKRDVDNYSFF